MSEERCYFERDRCIKPRGHGGHHVTDGSGSGDGEAEITRLRAALAKSEAELATWRAEGVVTMPPAAYAAIMTALQAADALAAVGRLPTKPSHVRDADWDEWEGKYDAALVELVKAMAKVPA